MLEKAWDRHFDKIINEVNGGINAEKAQIAKSLITDGRGNPVDVVFDDKNFGGKAPQYN